MITHERSARSDEYVTCHMCKNPETTLTRDSVTRLYFLQVRHFLRCCFILLTLRRTGAVRELRVQKICGAYQGRLPRHVAL